MLEPLRIDFCSQAAKRDPFPLWARLRETGPVVRVEVPIFGAVWMATTFDAVNAASPGSSPLRAGSGDGRTPLDGDAAALAAKITAAAHQTDADHG